MAKKKAAKKAAKKKAQPMSNTAIKPFINALYDAMNEPNEDERFEKFQKVIELEKKLKPWKHAGIKRKKKG